MGSNCIIPATEPTSYRLRPDDLLETSAVCCSAQNTNLDFIARGVD